MASIRGTNTSIERQVSALLKALALKARRHQKHLPGSPDFVLYQQHVIIFTNGCFWHRHQGCKRAALPVTNRRFWEKKISANARRDQRQRRLLRKLGWRVITFWSCQKLTIADLASRLRRVGVKIENEKSLELLSADHFKEADRKLKRWRRKINTPEKVAVEHRRVLLERVSQSMAFEGQPISIGRLKEKLHKN